MYDTQTQKVIVTRNVVFTEDNVPLKHGNEIDTLDILEEETINTGKSKDVSSTTSDYQEENFNILSQSTQEGSSEEHEDEPLDEENSSNSGTKDSEEERITPPHRLYAVRLQKTPSRLVYIAN
jgi:hypothetical protein